MDDECRSLDGFKRIADKKALQCSSEIFSVFFDLVQCCVSRVPKKRPLINKVSLLCLSAQLSHSLNLKILMSKVLLLFYRCMMILMDSIRAYLRVN